MIVLTEAMEEITEYDLTRGSLTQTVRIRPDAQPIDNVTKFAYADEDYEAVMIYTPYAAEETPSTEDTILELTADHEYRLCMLELNGGE